MSRLYTRLLIGVLAFGVCLGVAFAAGTIYGRTTSAKAASANNTTSSSGASASSGTRSTSGSSSSSSSAAGASGTPAGRGSRTANGAGGASGASGSTSGGSGNGGAGATGTRGFGGGGFGGAARFMAGTIKAVNGSTITISTTFGADETVKLSSSAKIGSVAAAGQSTLKSGQTVLVSGQRDASGNVTATSIVTVPNGFLPSSTGGNGANVGTGNSANASSNRSHQSAP